MQRHEQILSSRPVRTLYIGGGTPTALSSAQLDRLFDIISARSRVNGTYEVTVEANPATVNAEKLALLSRCGVTRLSIGAQSFSDDVLASLGRAHSAGDSIGLFHAARSAGFRNVGLDLIYGIPGLSERQWMHALETAVELAPEHLSVYALSLDEGSPMSREAAAGLLRLPDDETAAGHYAAAAELLALHGYRRYEISNYALPGRACLHNRNYWARGEYLGLGPGAWSFLGKRRSLTVADLDEYRSRLADGRPLASFEEVLEPVQVAAEALALGLRCAEGIDLEQFASLAGKDAAAAVSRRLNGLAESGLFRVEGTMVMLTTKGMLLSNDAISRIIP